MARLTVELDLSAAEVWDVLLGVEGVVGGSYSADYDGTSVFPFLDDSGELTVSGLDAES